MFKHKGPVFSGPFNIYKLINQLIAHRALLSIHRQPEGQPHLLRFALATFKLSVHLRENGSVETPVGMTGAAALRTEDFDLTARDVLDFARNPVPRFPRGVGNYVKYPLGVKVHLEQRGSFSASHLDREAEYPLAFIVV